MNENFDDIDLAACSRRARRWAIGLVCLLAINGSLVALALGGFGAAQPRSIAAARPVGTIVPAPKKAGPLGTVPLPSQASEQRPAKAQPVERPAIADPPAGPPQPADPAPPNPSPKTKSSEPPLATPAPPVDVPPAKAPPEPPAAPPLNVVPIASESLILVNPPTTGGEVHFAVEGVVYRLEAGEFCELAGRRERRIEFHRGEEFGYANHQFAGGALAFSVGETGWTLTQLESAAARELLSTCRGKSR